MNTLSTTPWWFWLVAVLAVLWNSGGVMDFTMTHTHNAEYLASFTVAERTYFSSFPLWANIAWALGVFGGLIGSLLLLVKSRLAQPIYLISIVGMAVSFAYQFISDAPASLYSGGAMAFTVAIWIVAFLLLGFTQSMIKTGVLR